MWCFAVSAPVFAGGITNTFDTTFNYVADGILGDTNWDGVYLNFGDVPGGGAGGSGNGLTTTANSSLSFAGFLTVQTTRSDWSGTGTDGFFLYKVVSGDFDVSVQSVPPFNPVGFNFAGLMVRAFNTNSGGAMSTTSVTPAENITSLWRFNEFNLDGQIRITTNNAVQELSFGGPGSNAETNSPRYLRITRVGDVLSFYIKTNLVDAWTPVTNGLAGGVQTRSDWAGLPLQVGIAQAMFSTASTPVYFDDFELTGPNVTTPAMPTAPSNVTVTSPNTSGSVNVSWTPGAGSDGSLVLIRANGPIIAQPAHGFVYTADSNFTNSSTLLGADRSHVVYVGAGNSLTVSGLGGTNNTYSVAVFSYSGSGASTVYNTAQPATNSFVGPGQVASVNFTLTPANIPIHGVARATVIATYTSGDSYDVSSDTSTIWGSGDPTVAIAGNGLVTGLTNGTVSITATYAGVLGANNVTVVTPAFRDEFNVNRDYLSNGVVGSSWDGVYLGAGDVPLQLAGNLGAGAGIVTNCNANISSNNTLTVTHRQTGWEGNENDGFFLFKKVPGDFQVAVKIESYQNAAFHFPGLMARLSTTNGGALGTTNTTFIHGRESHVRWMRFDEFGISTSARRNLNGGNQVFDSFDGDTTAYWLLMVRQGTNFFFYKRAAETDNWTAVPGATRILATATNGAPMQVGLGSSTFDSGVNFRSVSFSHFMLDGANVNVTGTPPSPASGPSYVSNPDGSLTLSWINGAGSAGSLVVMRAAKPVNVTPQYGVTYTANSTFGLGNDLGSGSYAVYNGTGTSVTVTGLLPGTLYYATVFSYSGAGATTSYNVQGATQTSQTAIGAVQSITFTLPEGNQLVKGGVLPFVSYANYLGGVSNNVSTQVTVESSPAGYVVGGSGYLTGLTNGATTVSVIFSGKTNSAAVVVNNPDYADNFGVSHNYAGGTVQGIWDGVYLGSADVHPANSIPGTTGPATTTVADANISSNNVLTVTANDTAWSGADNEGFFLYRYVAGDFQAAVQVASLQKDTNGVGTVPFLFAGLMARAYGDTNLLSGAPYNGSEDWVYLGQFQQFNVSLDARHALNGADNELPIFDGATNDFYLLMVRKGGTFTFFRRVSPVDAWQPLPTTTIVRNDLAGVPLQVGLFQATYTANSGTAGFADFVLDETFPAIQFASGGGSMTLNIPAIPVVQLQSSGSLSPANWQPVAGGSAITNGLETLIVPIGNTNQFFRLAR
jgi:hypothetical protein